MKTPARWTFKSCGDFYAVCLVPGVSSSKDQMSVSMIGAALGEGDNNGGRSRGPSDARHQPLRIDLLVRRMRFVRCRK